MPGTRYSATFDRTYVEESPANQQSPVRFSIQSWQGASLPGNPPLNGSYKHHAQTASTDSLDSSGTGASSTSSGSGTGLFTQMSMDCPGDSYLSTRKTTKMAPVNKNALQFVKVGPVPLYKKAVEQIQLSKEVRVAKDCDKEETEQWQNNLDSWKSRRKKLSEKSIQRVEDLKLLAQDTDQQRPTRTKTFSEMMENRAQKPRGYNLSIYVENESDDFHAASSIEPKKNKENEMNTVFTDTQGDGQQEHFLTEKNEENRVVGAVAASQSDQEHVSNVRVDYEHGVFPVSKAGNGSTGDEQCSNSKGSSVACAEDDCNGCGMYTVDSGLESFGSSQRVGDIQDSSSELSVDSSGGYDRGLNEDDTDGHSNAHQGEGGELGLPAGSQVWSTDLDQKVGYVQLNLRLWLNSETKDKDFGFSVAEDQGRFVVESVRDKGPAYQGGLHPKDQILAVNGESTAGRSKSSVTFAMKQSIYNGHLDLIISRSNNEDTKDQKDEVDDSACVMDPAKISFSQSSVASVKQRFQNGHSFDGGKCEGEVMHGDTFRGRSKSESSQTWEERQALPKKKLPPPVPVKPKLSSVVMKNQYESDSHAPIVRTISNEMKLERMCASDYMLRDDVSDISKEMHDAEDELDQEMIVYSGLDSPGGEPADLVFCVEQDAVAELRHSTTSSSCSLDANDTGPKQYECQESSPETPVPLHHVKEEGGLTIIFESHPSQIRPDFYSNQLVPVKLSESSLSSNCDTEESVAQQSLVMSQETLQQQQQQQQDIEHVLQSLVTQVENTFPEASLLDLTQEVEIDLQDDSQESEWVREELSAICPEESCTLDSLLVGEQHSPALHPDDQLLVDLASHAAVMDPPKEKPPPPPPADSPEQIPKMNTFKRVKKDLWKRRSDFLGIDASGDELDVDVPPPPDLSEILKSELDLERQNRLWLEKERFLSSSSSCSNGHERTSSVDSQVADNDIAQREREIIDNLEREEQAKHTFDIGDQGTEGEEKVEALAQSKEDERIMRLQDERRRMEEERFQREEIRIRAEEDRLFKDREDELRRQEEESVGVASEGRPCPPAPSVVANPPPPPSGCKDSRPVILPKPNRLSQNLDRACPDSVSRMDTGLEKEALEVERLRLQRDQERLQKEKEEYRRHMESEHRKTHEAKVLQDSRTASDRQVSEKSSAAGMTLTERDAVIFASKKPQGLSDTSPDSSPRMDFSQSPQGLSAQGSPEPGSDALNGSQQQQQMNRNALHFLGAAPKARIIQSEQWISQQDTASKRRSDPVIGMGRERGYNQNHWLVQEAEIRRITEQSERQQQQQSDHRRHSASASLRSQAPPPASMGTNGPPVPGQAGVNSNKLPRHISSTIPRPYQRMPPPPPPPPKPPHGMPVQASQVEQPWNYRPVSSVGLPPRMGGTDKPYVEDICKYRSESVLGVPSSWSKAPTAETQPEHLLSVSGKERCSHCAQPLGCGGAMIIESLQLYYHMHCFSCCVCQAPLGNGTCGTDVRVRNQKLHCQNCYSNDEAGLKFSQV